MTKQLTLAAVESSNDEAEEAEDDAAGGCVDDDDDDDDAEDGVAVAGEGTVLEDDDADEEDDGCGSFVDAFFASFGFFGGTVVFSLGTSMGSCPQEPSAATASPPLL